MSYARGEVVVAVDPFESAESAARPFLIVNRPGMPFHGKQYVALALTTRTWYDGRIPLAESDWVAGGAPETSSIVPWSVNTVKDEWVNFRQGAVADDVVARAVSEFVGYVE